MATIGRRAYAEMFGPTVGDRVRLADTDLLIEVEHDLTLGAGGYGEEVKFGGGKTIRDGMAQSQRTRGEGAMRTAAPDSARVDLFLTGGISAGYAVLIGDSLRAPNKAVIERVLPPPPMMWAALGRLAIPPLPDTVVTEEGGTIYAEIGRPAVWRVTIKGGRLTQLARLSGGRIAELVTRDEGGRLLYEVPGRRKLWLAIIRDEEVPPFAATIWTR